MEEFDLDDFLDAFRAKDLQRWADWYATHAEWVEYRHEDPPRDPHVMRGREEIGAHLAAVCAAPIDIAVDHVVPGTSSAAFMVTVTLPGGRRIIENVIIEIGGGRVSRQIDVEAWD